MNNSLYYLHIPKTAGTSLISFLDTQFPPEKICPAQLLTELFQLNKESLNGYDFFRGHLWFGLDRFAGKPFNYITMLRDPIQRTISWYSHVRRDSNAYRHDRVVEENWSLLDFVSDAETQWDMVNAQTIFLAADLDFDRLSKDPVSYGTKVIRDYASRKNDRALLDLAKARLEKFAFVGITERMNHSLQLLTHVLGVYPSFSNEKLNTSPNRVAADSLSKETIDAIEAITPLDQELYNWAADIFASKYDEFVQSLLVRDYISNPKSTLQGWHLPLPPNIGQELNIRVTTGPKEVVQQSHFQVEVEVTNESRFHIGTGGQYPINLSYHWINPASGEILIFDGTRTHFPYPLSPNGVMRLNVDVLAPAQSLSAILRLTLVQEGVAWMDSGDHPVFSDSQVLIK